MRRGPVSGVLRMAPFLALLALTRCRHEEPPPLPAPVPAPSQVLDPWSFHFVGGLLVITGETEDAVEVTLKGPTLNETRTLPFGPIRWEMLRPPPHEVAELRTKDGKLLMLFNFDSPPPPRTRTPEPVVVPQAAPVKAVPPPPPAKPTPAPAAPAPVPQASPAKPSAPAAPVHPAVATAPPPALPRVSASPAVPRPAPPRPAPVALAPAALAPSRPARAADAGPARPVPAPVPPPAPAPAPRPVAKLPPPPPPPAPAPVPPPNPKVPPRPVLIAKVANEPVLPPLHPVPDTAAQAWPGAGEGLNLLRGPKGQRRICMTFDGGSTSEVAVDILDALKARGIHTTIFLTGDFIRKYPDLVRRMDREGHELGNHTLTHPHLAPGMRRDPAWTRERFQRELLEADRALYQLLGRPFDPYWRAPFGEHTTEIRKWAEELGYRHVGWSEGADTLDWATTSQRKLYRTGNAILDKLRARMEKQDGDGLIVLMHLGSERPSGDRPAQVLGPFLDKALQDGWHFVSVGEYVKGLGKPKWEPVRRVALLR